jgi:hypothetical protein
MNFEQFSNEIIKTYDIDPDYVFLINYKKKYGEFKTFELFKKKLLIYNLSSELLYTDGFITKEQIKFGNERQKSKPYFSIWEKILSPLTLDKLKKFHGIDYLTFKDNFTKIKGMGNWASWKAADILDKVFDVKMIFKDQTFLNAYEYPLKGLLLLNGEKEDTSIYKNNIFLYKKHLQEAKNQVKNSITNNVFNPNNLLELETLLCKYHSYKHNKYKPNDDLKKIRKIKEDSRLIQYHNLLP